VLVNIVSLENLEAGSLSSEIEYNFFFAVHDVFFVGGRLLPMLFQKNFDIRYSFVFFFPFFFLYDICLI